MNLKGEHPEPLFSGRVCSEQSAGGTVEERLLRARRSALRLCVRAARCVERRSG